MASICLDDDGDDDGGISLSLFFFLDDFDSAMGVLSVCERRDVCVVFPMDEVKGVGVGEGGGQLCMWAP